MEEIDIKDLIFSFWKRKIKILVILVIFAIIGTSYSYFIIKPMYNSTSTVLVTQSIEVKEDDEVKANSKLIPTYAELIKTDKVIETVVKNINNPEITSGNIKSSISVQIIKDTEVVKITVKNSNSEYAAIIANEVAKISCEKLKELYSMTNTYILDTAIPSTVPYNINHTKDIVIFVFIGVIVAIGYVLIANIIEYSTNKTKNNRGK